MVIATFGIPSQLCHFIRLCLRANCLTSLNLGVLLDKMGRKPDLSYKAIAKIEDVLVRVQQKCCKEVLEKAGNRLQVHVSLS